MGNLNDDYHNFQSTPHVMEERTDLVEGPSTLLCRTGGRN